MIAQSLSYTPSRDTSPVVDDSPVEVLLSQRLELAKIGVNAAA